MSEIPFRNELEKLRAENQRLSAQLKAAQNAISLSLEAWTGLAGIVTREFPTTIPGLQKTTKIITDAIAAIGSPEQPKAETPAEPAAMDKYDGRDNND